MHETNLEDEGLERGMEEGRERQCEKIETEKERARGGRGRESQRERERENLSYL